MKTLYLCGAGNPEGVRLAITINEKQNRWDRIVLLDDDPQKHGKSILGVEIVGPFELLEQADVHSSEAANLVSRTTAKRQSALQKIKKYGLSFAPLIDPNVDVFGVEFSKDIIVYPNATFAAGASVGEGVVVFMGAIVGHGCNLSQYCVVGPGAVINARVQVGQGVYIGTNASILPDLKIGPWATIGINTAVVQDVPAGATVMGVPGEILMIPDEKPGCVAQPISKESDQECISLGAPTEEIIAEICCRLLGIKRLEIEDSFFELGGHSLFAVNLIAHLNKIFKVKLSMSKIFEIPTVAGLAAAIDEHKSRENEAEDAIISLPQITPNTDLWNEPFPLTDLQQAYWVGRRNAFGVGNVASKVLLELEYSQLDLGRFNRAWQLLINRHDMMRFIVNEDGQGRILEKVPPYQFEISDLRGKDQQTIEQHLKDHRDKTLYENKSTDNWPLFDVNAFLLDEKHTRVVFCLDQLFVDAASVVLIFNELYQLYDDPDTQLTPLEITFRDYALGEVAFKKSDAYKRSREYWIERLDRMPPAPELPLAKAACDTNVPRFVRRKAKLEPELWNKIKNRAAEIGVTYSGVLAAVFAQVLTLWSKSPRFTLNVPIFNRLDLHPQVNSVIGEFASFVLLEVDNSQPDSFDNRARRIQKQLWDNFEHCYFNGVCILRGLARIKGRTSAALMPVVFTSLFHSNFTESASKLGRLTNWITQTAQVWFDHHIIEDDDGALVFNWDCLDELFPEGLLDDMFDAYNRLLLRLANDCAAWEESWQEAAIKMLPNTHVELRNAVNNNTAPIPEKLLQNLFEERVEEYNNKPAVITSNRTLTYGELDRLSSFWGNRLSNPDLQSGKFVAVVMEKGWEQVVSVLGILKSGAAYVPIDAGVPKERLWYLLRDSKAKVVLTQSWLEKSRDWPEGVKLFSVDQENIPTSDIPSVKHKQDTDDTACVIYTSGSTGLPKGAMLTHRGIINCIIQTNKYFEITSEDKVLALTALHHDMSIFDIFGMLACGGSLVMPDSSGRRDPAHWSELMLKENVTLWNSVPAMMEMFLEYADKRSGSVPQSLRLAYLGGDWIPLTIPGRLSIHVKDAKLVSVGGPTETTLWNIWYPIDKVKPGWKSIPYGKPIANTKYYVYNSNLDECPVWVPGELCVSSVGVAKGYWQNEEKTAEKFIVHPRTGERLYLTGDLGRYLPDGNIEILGRMDFQVKIQGQRIELGEIEHALQQHEAVRNAVVIMAGEQHGGKNLVAYIVPVEGKTFQNGEINKFLEGKLPAHMIPAVYMHLDRLPLTANGKIDRAGLPSPEKAPGKHGMAQQAEQDGVILKIAGLVSSILEIGSVDPDANLISLGANSIDMVRIGNMLEKEFGTRPRIDQIFFLQTVRAISEFYEEEKESKSEDASIISIPYEQGIDNEDIKDLIAGYKVQIDPDERQAFRDSEPGLRQIEAQATEIQLNKPLEDEAFIEKYRERCSHRNFSLKPVPFEQFSKLLSSLYRISLDGKPKYLYGSPGGLNPGQVYLHFKPGRVDGISPGTYYYDPAEHRLIVLTENAEIDRNIHVPFINAPIFDEAAFSMFIAADLNAIGPNYGKYSLYYSVVEAGIMAQLLEMTAPKCGIGLCQIGSLNFDKIRHLFKLQKSHIIVHSLLGGLMEMHSEETGDASDSNEQGEVQKTARLLKKVKDLSEEEVKKLLDATKDSG